VVRELEKAIVGYLRETAPDEPMASTEAGAPTAAGPTRHRDGPRR
jgi:hypothetical protein